MKLYWTPEGQLRAAVIALNISGYSVDRIAESIGMSEGFVRFVLGINFDPINTAN